MGLRTLSDHTDPKASWSNGAVNVDSEAHRAAWEPEAEEKEPVGPAFAQTMDSKMGARAVAGFVTGFDSAGGVTSVLVAADLIAPMFYQEIMNIFERHGVDEQARTSLRLLAGRFQDAAVDILWRLNWREPLTFGSGSTFVMMSVNTRTNTGWAVSARGVILRRAPQLPTVEQQLPTPARLCTGRVANSCRLLDALRGHANHMVQRAHAGGCLCKHGL